MGQQDLAQKNLEYYPDVFADIVNALLYEGKQVLSPNDLQPAPTETLYPGQRKSLRNQFHDVSKYEMREDEVKVQYTLENETRCNGKTVLRKAGYEGAVYREQYDKKVREVYPVISLVLYWGRKRWQAAQSLRTFFQKKALSEDVQSHIDDVKLYVYNMRELPKEVRMRFNGDMRIVVDYLAERGEYRPTNQPIIHVDAFLRLMRALTGDSRYEWMAFHLEKAKKEEVTMCELLDKYEARGMEKGLEKGLEKGETLLAKLMEYLFRDNRIADAKLVATDVDMRKKLYREYGLG